jgi:S1-C subfamily serine protease
VKVLALGACGADHEGTGFVVSRGVVMTNAHVIAGASRVTVAGRTATVTALDTSNDLALLRVATDERPSLSFVTTVTAGMPAAVVGFPRDGDLTLTPVALGDSFSAQSRNIYNKVTFTRSLLSLAGDIQPGNSGSPVVTGGRVAGVVFSKSLSQRLTGYAIPATVAQSFFNTTGASTSPVSTGACTR